MKNILYILLLGTFLFSCIDTDDVTDDVDEIIPPNTIFDKLLSETSWSYPNTTDPSENYIQFYNVENNKDKMKWYILRYYSGNDCYIPGFHYEHQEDEAKSIMTVLENSVTAFVLERDINGEGSLFFRTSFFEENNKMIFQTEYIRDDGTSSGDGQRIISPSDIIIDTNLVICID